VDVLKYSLPNQSLFLHLQFSIPVSHLNEFSSHEQSIRRDQRDSLAMSLHDISLLSTNQFVSNFARIDEKQRKWITLFRFGGIILNEDTCIRARPRPSLCSLRRNLLGHLIALPCFFGSRKLIISTLIIQFRSAQESVPKRRVL
jgi:hypothetical protein